MDFTKLKAYLDTFYAEKNIPGVGFAMYHHHEPVCTHYTGFADVEGQVPFGPDTLFHLYSATKLITCTAALQLLEKGLYALTDPVAAYIPEYSDLTVRHMLPDGTEAIRPAQNTLTIEHLFSMRSGISGNRDAAAVQAVLADTQGTASTLDVVRAYAADPLNFEPGMHFQYGISHDVLAGLIEAVTGMTFGAYIRQNILDPIGMPETTFRPTPAQQARMAKLYNGFDAATGTSQSIGQSFVLAPSSAYESGGGGLISCVPEYIRFAETLCNGGLTPGGERILRPETIDDMRRNRLTGDAMADFEAFGGWSKAGYGYGLGVRTLMWRERNNALSENGEFGWDGARGCYVVVDPDAEVAIFYAQQEGGSRWYEWHGMVRNMAYASIWS